MDNIIAENLLLVCSICLDSIADYREWSVAKLKCGHQFHLDCICSAFNIKGAMMCPNCGQTEAGHWQYANSSAALLSDSDFSFDLGSFAEHTYEYLVAEEPFGAPFSGLSGGHSWFQQVELSSTPNGELLGNHAIFAEHMAASPLAHSHVNPFHPASVQYHGWGTSSFPRCSSLFGSSLNHPGSITCPHESILGSHAGHPPQNFPTSLTWPIIPGSQNLHEENMGFFSHFPVMWSESDSGSGSQPQGSEGAEPSHRYPNFWPQLSEMV